MLNGKGEQLRRVNPLEFYAQEKGIDMRNLIEYANKIFQSPQSFSKAAMPLRRSPSDNFPQRGTKQIIETGYG